MCGLTSRFGTAYLLDPILKSSSLEAGGMSTGRSWEILIHHQNFYHHHSAVSWSVRCLHKHRRRSWFYLETCLYLVWSCLAVTWCKALTRLYSFHKTPSFDLKSSQYSCLSLSSVPCLWSWGSLAEHSPVTRWSLGFSALEWVWVVTALCFSLTVLLASSCWNSAVPGAAWPLL